ncbi:uncharacterized protein [Nicotiana sylvestris]|uniref:uncharacterized protein n=1 Tax=Nicotiana sylvestris TaxID=4096 RepID=UPI00388CBE4D
MQNVPWFVDLANFLVSGIIPDEFSSNQMKKLKRDCQDYYWDEPYLFRICTDAVIRRCVQEEEQCEILEACHSSPYSGHHGRARIAAKVLSCGFYWPTFYKDASDLVRRCDECLMVGGSSKKNEMPLTTILETDIFDVWDIEFMGPFVSSCENTYVLVVVDYVSKWVEAVSLPNNEARSVVAFLKKNIFTRFRSLLSRSLIFRHFINQPCNQAQLAYRTAYKTPIKISPYQLVVRKDGHFLVELEHKDMWALKKLNLEWDVAANLRVAHLNKLDEFWYHAYTSSSLYKEKIKYLHEKYIWNKEFKEGDLVLLFNS